MQTKIISLGMNGEGVGKVDGKTVFVPYALPEEIVDFFVTLDKGNYAVSNLEKVITPCKERTTPLCPYFSTCGGCQLQHMNYALQLKFKKDLVQNTLKKIANINVEVCPTVASELQFEYRNKASFNFACDCAGFYKSNSKEIVEVKSCPLQHKIINEIYAEFKNFLKNKPFKNKIKHLVVRHINKQTLVGVVATEKVDLLPLYKTLNSKFGAVGVYLYINTRKDSVVLTKNVTHESGIKTIKIENCGLNYEVDLTSFHQTNIDIQNKIYAHVLNNINAKDVVVNGFSGAGLLSGMLTKIAQKVYGIELEKSAHNNAEKLKQENGIKTLTNLCGDFFKLYKPNLNPSVVVLDPSKKGCGAKVMQKICGVDKIIYVSCNPIALSKDLREIINFYNIESITPFDMFPNTSNVETVCVLRKK